LKINTEKTKVRLLVISKNDVDVDIKRENVKLKQVNEFTYFGAVITKDGSCKKDI